MLGVLLDPGLEVVDGGAASQTVWVHITGDEGATGTIAVDGNFSTFTIGASAAVK